MSIVFDYAARSDVGLVRRSNQDSAYAGPHLAVMADGMGGPAGGDIASSVAVAHLSALDSLSVSWPLRTKMSLHLWRIILIRASYLCGKGGGLQ